jgi:hypothetical protein
MIDLDNMALNIKNHLEKVEGIKQAFDYEPDRISHLPAATLYFDGFQQSEGTSRKNNVSWQWVIRLYIPLRTSDVSTPQKEVRKMVQNTLNQLRTDISLGGTCLYHSVSSGDVFALFEQNNPLMVAELILTTTTEEYF